MKNKDGQKTTARKIALEIFADALDMMLDRGVSNSQDYTEKETEAIEAQLKKIATQKLKGTGFTNIRL